MVRTTSSDIYPDKNTRHYVHLPSWPSVQWMFEWIWNFSNVLPVVLKRFYKKISNSQSFIDLTLLKVIANRIKGWTTTNRKNWTTTNWISNTKKQFEKWNTCDNWASPESFLSFMYNKNWIDYKEIFLHISRWKISILL